MINPICSFHDLLLVYTKQMMRQGNDSDHLRGAGYVPNAAYGPTSKCVKIKSQALPWPLENSILAIKLIKPAYSTHHLFLCPIDNWWDKWITWISFVGPVMCSNIVFAPPVQCTKTYLMPSYLVVLLPSTWEGDLSSVWICNEVVLCSLVRV